MTRSSPPSRRRQGRTLSESPVRDARCTRVSACRARAILRSRIPPMITNKDPSPTRDPWYPCHPWSILHALSRRTLHSRFQPAHRALFSFLVHWSHSSCERKRKTPFGCPFLCASNAAVACNRTKRSQAVRRTTPTSLRGSGFTTSAPPRRANRQGSPQTRASVQNNSCCPM